jgi:hypothetical protein
MAHSPREPEPPYRVVVRARPGAQRRDFIWEIVRIDRGDQSVVKASIRSFRSMEEAYDSGAAALGKLPKPPGGIV